MADIRQTGWIDQFNRADEDPLAAPWAQTDPTLSGAMALKSQNVTHRVGFVSGDDYWTTQAFTGDVEVWGNMEGGLANGIAWALDLWQQPGGTTAVDGYRLRQEVSSGQSAVQLYRVANATATSIAITNNAGVAQGGANVYMLFRVIASSHTLEGYYSVDTGANWTQTMSHVDSTYTGTFYIGCGIRDNSGLQILGWNGIGGGAPGITRTSFFRRPSN